MLRPDLLTPKAQSVYEVCKKESLPGIIKLINEEYTDQADEDLQSNIIAGIGAWILECARDPQKRDMAKEAVTIVLTSSNKKHAGVFKEAIEMAFENGQEEKTVPIDRIALEALALGSPEIGEVIEKAYRSLRFMKAFKPGMF